MRQKNLNFVFVQLGQLGTSYHDLISKLSYLRTCYFGSFWSILVNCIGFSAFGKLGSGCFWLILVKCNNFDKF